jgi:hypothetical protein
MQLSDASRAMGNLIGDIPFERDSRARTTATRAAIDLGGTGQRQWLGYISFASTSSASRALSTPPIASGWP